MSVDERVSAERLRELLIELEESQQRERELRAQSDALLAGVRALAEASSPAELFTRILESLRDALAFDDAFVLRGTSGSDLVVTSSTAPVFLGTRWELGKSFARILSAGRVAIHVDTSLVAEWIRQPPTVREAAGSSLCIPLRGSSEVALLVCTKRVTKGFVPSHEQVARRFQPLATQALRDAERVAQIERANRDMRLVLDSVDQGLLMLDREARIVAQPSGAFHAWFGEVEAGATFGAVAGRLRSSFAEEFDLAWDQLVSDILPREVALQVMPSRLVACVAGGERTLALQYRPIGDGDDWSKLLVVVTDVTGALAREIAEERRRELASIVTRAVRDRDGVVAFWDDARATVRALSSGEITDPVVQLRLLHTLKGNALTMGLESIGRIAHELEEDARDRFLTLEAFEALTQRVEAIDVDIAAFMSAAPSGIAITADEHAWLLRELGHVPVTAHLVPTVTRWNEERVEATLARLADQARSVAERTGDRSIEVVVAHDDARADARRFQPVYAALTHAIRNAVGHGIEPAAERVAIGKTPFGRITLSATRTDVALTLTIRDDGRGIDWDAVRASASSRGMPCATSAELSDALFADGLTTSASLSDVSGRGVGLSALRAEVVALGGDVVVDSIRGSGTSLTCVLPLATSGHRQAA